MLNRLQGMDEFDKPPVGSVSIGGSFNIDTL